MQIEKFLNLSRNSGFDHEIWERLETQSPDLQTIRLIKLRGDKIADVSAWLIWSLIIFIY